VRFAEALPPALQISAGSGKALLRRALAGRLSPALLERAKHGFSVPLASWIQGPWRGAVDDLMLSPRARERGIVRAGAAERLLAEVAAGASHRAYPLYDLMALEVWHRRFADG
jgi:asparagine synthase (glutamine-hydrolysing)